MVQVFLCVFLYSLFVSHGSLDSHGLLSQVSKLPVDAGYRENLPEYLHKYWKQNQLPCPRNRIVLPWMKEMEEFVHRNQTKTILYIFYHDTNSMHKAANISSCYDWMYPIKLRISPFAESQVYKDIFLYLQDYWIEQDIKYIITTSYKIIENEKILRVKLKDYFSFLNYTHYQNYDFTPIFRLRQPLLNFSMRMHGEEFKPAWDSLLTAMGYQEEQIRRIDHVPGFFKNSFICRLPVLLGITNFMNYAMHLLEYNQTVKHFASVNAQYPGKMTTEQLKSAFKANYYQMHPFMLERLPIFYVHNMRLRICHNNNKFCMYNM